MKNKHTVHHQEFDIKYPTQPDILQLQEELNRFASKRLIAITDEVLCKHDQKDAIIRIDNLSIDLGTIALTDYQFQMESRLRQELDNALQHAIKLIKTRPDDKNNIVPLSRGNFELLEYFLYRGSVPWNFTAQRYQSLDELFIKVLNSETDRFIQFIKKAGQEYRIRKRLVSQFSDETLCKLIGKLEPANADYIIDYVADISKSQKQAPVSKVSEREFAEISWEVCLAYLLVESGNYFNRREFVRATLRKLAQHFNIEYSALLHDFYRTIPELSEKHKKGNSLMSVISDLYASDINKQPQSNDAAHDQTPAETIIAVLAKGSLVAQFDKHWKLLLNCKAADIQNALHSFAHSDNTLRQLAQRISHECFNTLLLQIAPLDYFSFIDDLFASLNESQTQRVLAEIIKTQSYRYIILRELSVENRFSYLPVVQMLFTVAAQQTNKTYFQILNDAQRQLPQSMKNSSIDQVYKTLMKLQDQIMDLQSKHSKVLQKKIDGIELWEHFSSYLLYGIRQSHSVLVQQDIKELIRNIFRNETNIGNRLVEKLKSDSLYISRACQMPSDEIHELMLQLMHYKNGSAPHPSFISSLHSHSQQTNNSVQFYRQILSSVLDGSPIDFESIEQKTETNKPQTKHASTESMVADIVSCLRNWLKDNATEKEYQQLLRQFIEQQPKQIDSLLTVLQQSETIYQRFIKYSGTQLLESAACTLAPSVYKIPLLKCLQKLFIDRCRIETHIFWDILLGMPHTPAIDFGNSTETLFQQLFQASASLPDQHIILKADYMLQLSAEQTGLMLKTLSEAQRKREDKNSSIKTSTPINATANNITLAKLHTDNKYFIPLIECAEGTAWGIDNTYKHRQAFDQVMKEKPEAVAMVFEQNLGKASARACWLKQLSGQQLASIAYLLCPMHFSDMQKLIECTERICSPALKHRSLPRHFAWTVILEYLADKPVYNQHSFLSLYLEKLSAEVPAITEVLEKHTGNSKNIASTPQTEALVHEQIQKLKQLNAIIQQPVQKIPKPIKEKDTVSDEYFAKETIYIDNAGIILLAPYLPPLFSRIGLLEMGKFKSPESAQRAMHILQYAASKQCDLPEYQLLLNKLLCGIKTGVPVCKSIDLSDEEKNTVESLLQGIIAQWSALGKTSADGFRESFLQRKGKLSLQENNWHLYVEPQAYDMLLDKLPWSINSIKLSWMDKLIITEWRQ